MRATHALATYWTTVGGGAANSAYFAALAVLVICQAGGRLRTNSRCFRR